MGSTAAADAADGEKGASQSAKTKIKVGATQQMTATARKKAELMSMLFSLSLFRSFVAGSESYGCLWL
jgi:hypothetical protein